MATRPSRFWPRLRNCHARLIVLGATQRSALQNLTRDRTVYQVLAHARCPVLTLREPLARQDEVVAESIATHG